MDPQAETQTKVIEEQISDRQLQYEKGVDDRFESIEKQLALQPTKEEFETMIAGLASKDDIATFNSYVHRFYLGVEILGKSSKWAVYTVITLGSIAAGVIFLKNAIIWIIALFGVAITRVR